MPPIKPTGAQEPKNGPITPSGVSASNRKAENLAQRFHEIYEELAPAFNYKTRKASAVPWSDVPQNNKQLMIAVCQRVLDEL